MHFRFPCQQCGKKLKVDEEHVGRKARCPHCRTAQTIPEPEPAASSAASSGTTPEAKQKRTRPETPEGQSPAADPSAADAGATRSEPDASDQEPPSGPGILPRLVGQESNTDVSAWRSALLGLALTGLVYLLLYPFRESIGALFYQRGWVPVVLTLLLCWAFGILLLKYFKLQWQRDAMLFDVLPTEIGEDITTENLPQFMDHLRSLPMEPTQSFFLNRVLRGLEHYRVRGNANEVTSVLQSQSDIDNNAVGSSYSLLGVFLWAIPILGFIGTVLGISSAVAAFSSTVAGAGELSDMKESLGSVMGGLGTAFDTTLLALCMAVVLIFPMKAMQKAEEDLLNEVDEYTNDNLLKRLQDQSENSSDSNEDRIEHTIHEAMAHHHAELRNWHEKLESIGTTFRENAEQQWQQIHERLMEEHRSREQNLSQQVEKLIDRQTKSAEKIGEQYKPLMEEVGKLQQQIGELQKQEAEHTSTHQQSLSESAQSMQESVEALQRCVANVEEGLGSLSSVLRDLDGRTVTVQKPRRGLFGRRKRDET